MSAGARHSWPWRGSKGSAVLAGLALGLASQCGAHPRQFLLLRRVDLWVCEIQLLYRFHNRGGDNKPRKPLFVGWHHEPRRVLRCGGANSLFVCPHVVVPELTFLDVGSRELPVLLGSIETLQKAFLLFLARHLEEELEDDDSLTSEVILEMLDIGEPLVPYALPDKRPGHLLLLQDVLVHAHNQDLLVIGAVEYPDPPALGQTLRIPPHEVVVEVLLGGLLERENLAALRIHA